MKFANPFDAEFWIYPEPLSNVVHLNTPHARANAAQAAMLLEDDRAAMSHDQQLVCDLWRQKREKLEEIAQIDSMLEALTHE